MASAVAVYMALFGGFEKQLSPGERGYIFLISTDRDQSRILLNYIKAYLQKFKQHLKEEKQYEIELENNITIAVRSCNFRGTRGYTNIAVIADELAFWRDSNSANPASQVIASLRPGMATVKGSLLLGLSSPYSANGFLYEQWKKYKDGHNPKIKVWKRPSIEMNPSLDPDFIEEEIKKDVAAGLSEWKALWRKGISQFLDISLLDDSIQDITIRPVRKGIRYHAFIDPSSGQGSDSMTISIAHKKDDVVFQDFIQEIKPPFSPKSVVKRFAEILRNYRCDSVTSDKYSLGWVQDSFADEGITIKYSEWSTSELYLKAETLFTMKRVRLLKNEKQRAQWLGLERHTRRGRHGDLVTHMKGEHDDVSNACAGALIEADRKVINDEEMDYLLPQKSTKTSVKRRMEKIYEDLPPWHDDAEQELSDFMRASGGRKGK